MAEMFSAEAWEKIAGLLKESCGLRRVIEERDQRVAALEAELAHAKLHEGAVDWGQCMINEQIPKVVDDLCVKLQQVTCERAALEAELQPWRQMARQLEALRVPTFGEAFNVEVYGDRGNDVWSVYLFDADGGKYVGKGDTIPAAVAAAYGKVVGDE